METVQIVLLLIFNLVFYGTVLIYLPYYLAKRKGRDPLKFILLSLIFHIFVWIYLIFCKSQIEGSGNLDLYDAVKSINGVSEKKARIIIEKYPNKRALEKAKVSELEKIPGIGRKLAEAIKHEFA
jgi:uncharacterized membrane-anchored protein